MINQEYVLLAFNPFETNLLGVVGDYVYLKEDAFGEDETTHICVIKIKRTLFNKMCKEYLDRKAEYCNDRKYFCGAGYVSVDKYTKEGTMNIFVDIDDDENPIYKDVPMYVVLECFVDMEHG